MIKMAILRKPGKEEYELKTKCLNCMTVQFIFIKKGTAADPYLEECTCGNCGVMALKKITDPFASFDLEEFRG